MAKHSLKKIAINKNDEVALVVEKIIDSQAREIVLNIPRFSRLADSLANFHLIKRESNLLDKKIIVESVDDKAIELASLAGLESLNPVLIRSRRQFSDIVSSRIERGEESDGIAVKKKAASRIVHEDKSADSPKFPLAKTIALSGMAAMLILIIVLAADVLPRAEIKVVTKKISWNFKDSVIAEKLAAINPNTAKIPAQIFAETKTLQLPYPASGKKTVNKKAAGKITIYNAYSSDPQPLVATTRFVTPDGKIFRLTKGLVVPGAKIVSGKIIASSIETAVAADKPGADYNIGPVNYFSVPGFEGTPKYQGFYGESKEPMAGGFIGEVPYPTDDDIKKSKADALEKVESVLKDQVLAQIPPDFKVIDGASSFNILKQSINAEVDLAGNFSVVAEAAMKIAAFREQDLLAMLKERAEKEIGADYQFKDFELTYERVRFDPKSSILTFGADFKSSVAKFPDIDTLKEQILGKSEAELRALVLSLADLETAQISLWPFWVNRVPTSETKVKITVE
ncbi:MAG: hypothetical protein AAB646_01890 [Patescibacteria group bacterium]